MLAGHGSLVLVSGEAGIGKTTLVEWLAGEAEDQGCLVLRGGCYDLTTTPTYGPWLEIVEHYDPGDQLPPVPPFVNDANELARVGSQETLFAATRDLFRAIARQQPLVLVLEDLHWADQTSIDLLRFLSRQLSDQRVLVVVTYRTDELHRHHPLYPLLPLLVREARPERVEVRPFDDREQSEFIRSRYDLRDTDQRRLETYLAERAEGNPFFAGELLRSLEDAGALVQQGDAWEVSDLRRVRVPTLLRQVIQSRLDRLKPEARSLLQVGAIIGQEVPLEVWQQVTNAGDVSLATAIEQGLTERIIEESGAIDGYCFRHALLREALYEEVIVLRRRHWHQRVGDTLAASLDPDPDTVAYHYQRSGDPRAADWLIEAGDRAQRGYAWKAAAERLQAATLLLPGDAEHRRQRAWLLFRIGLLVRYWNHAQGLTYLKDALQLAEKSGYLVLEHLTRAHVGVVRSYEDDVQRGLREMEAGVLALEQFDEVQKHELELMEETLGATIGIQGRGTLTLRLAEQGRFQRAGSMLEDRHDAGPVDEADANRAAGTLHAFLGHPDLARQGFARARECYEAIHDLEQAGNDAAWEYVFVQIPYETDQIDQRRRLARLVQTLWNHETSMEPDSSLEDVVWAIDSVLTGDWTKAVAGLDHHMEHSVHSITPIHTWRLMVAMYCGDREMVWSEIRHVMPHGPATEFGDHRYFILDPLVRLAVEQALSEGDLEVGRAWLETFDRLLNWSGAVLGKAEGVLLWARYHHVAGDVIQARQHAEQALAHASNPRQPLTLISVHRFLGRLDTDAMHFVEAEKHFEASLILACACQTPFERALTLIELADLRLAQRRIDEAASLLDEVQSICEPLEAKPTLARTDALRQRLTQLTKATPHYPAGLSQREVEVLRLVAKGLTDAEVADRLFISRRTVTSHLTNIFNKLGVNARAAAVAAAAHVGIL
jgi:DNA-binding CsgD family transcriptional regulator